MPQTRFQNYVFTLLMVFCMVFCLASYNTALRQGLTYDAFLGALRGMWAEALAAFILQKFVAGPLAGKLLPRLVDPGSAKPLFVSVCLGGLTVFLMAPLMTLFVAIWLGGLGPDTPLLWLRLLALNFAVALCLQIFYVGPFVRLLFGVIFRRKRSNRGLYLHRTEL